MARGETACNVLYHWVVLEILFSTVGRTPGCQEKIAKANSGTPYLLGAVGGEAGWP